MPVSFEQDENGRVVRSGNYNPFKPAAPAARAKKPGGGNPFASMLGNLQKRVKAVDNALRYEQKRFGKDPVRRLTEIAKPVARKLTNDIRYELKPEVRRDPGRNLRNTIKLATNPLHPLADKVNPYTTSAAADVLRNGIEVYQRTPLGGRRQTSDYALNPLGRAVDHWEDTAYTEKGFKPRQEQEGLERLGTELATGVAAGAAAVAVGGASLGALATRVPATAPAVAGLTRLLNPTMAKTAQGALARIAMGGALEEVATTPFVDNTGGSAVSLLNVLLGTEFDDPVTPEQDRVAAMGNALIPNATAGALIPAALAALPLAGAFRSTRRAKQAQAEVGPIREARQTLETEGITATDPATGATAFTDQVLEQPKPEAPLPPPATLAEFMQRDLGDYPLRGEAAPAAPADGPVAPPTPADTEVLPDPWGAPEAPPAAAPTPAAAPAEAPKVEPDVDPYAREYDPTTTFEADVVLRELRELSYEDTLTLYQLDPTESVTAGIEDLGAARRPRQLESNVNWSEVSAPRQSVSEDWVNSKYRDRLGAQDIESLRGLFRNSPELQSMALSQTGKTVEQLTKADMLNILVSHPERVLLPGRLDNPFESSWDIAVRPDEYQFKQNTNEAGVQVGNSLQGVDRWDPDAEGVLEIRRRPEDGSLDMVNGHNRLDLAKRLGIPSVPVKYMRTTTAAEAREMGAISNISSGGGTIWDAAKFLRENPGLDTMAKLKASGKPGKSGFWRDGLALAQLPPDLFKAAQDGVIDDRYAVLIGNSRLPEEKMQTLFRKAASKPSMDTMTAYIEIARHSGGGDVIQGGLLGGEVEDLTDQLADLYAALQRNLADDKSLFGRVSKGAKKLRDRTASEVDVKGAISVSEEAKAAQNYVKDNWVTDPTLSKLMNDGARAIKNGESVASVVNEIKQAIPGIIEDAMSGRKAPELELGQAAPAAAEEAEVVEEAGTPLFDIAGDEDLGAMPAEAHQYMATPEQIAKWEAWKPERQDETAAWANKQLLSERQLANRKKKAAAVQEKEAGGLEPMNSEYKAAEAVQNHEYALSYLDWYDNRIARREPEPGEKAAMELELIRRGIANGELRPPDLAMPEVPMAEGVDMEGVANELLSGQPGEATLKAVAQEERLRLIYEEQDRAVEAAMVEAQREADGHYDAPYEDRIPTVLNEIEPVESTSIADMFQAVNEQLLESDRRTFRRIGEFLDNTKPLLDELAEETPKLPPGGDLQASVQASALDPYSLPPGHPTRIQAIKRGIRDSKVREETSTLMSWADLAGIKGEVNRLTERFGHDMQDAVQEGIRVSGIDPERFRVVRQIDMIGNFGVEPVAMSMDSWNPKVGEFIRADPSSPEALWAAAGQTSGLQAGEVPNLQMRDTIQVALNMTLDNTVDRFFERMHARNLAVIGLTDKPPKIGPTIEAVRRHYRTMGSYVHRTAYHESFHRLQKYALTPDELWTLEKNHARMKAIIQQGEGNWSKTMDGPEGQLELEAESFAVWAASRRARETGNPVDQIFQKLYDFLAPVRRKIRELRGMDTDELDLEDLFKAAYSGDIGKRSPSELANLSRAMNPELQSLMPNLAKQVKEQTRARLGEARALYKRLQDDLKNGGCT